MCGDFKRVVCAGARKANIGERHRVLGSRRATRLESPDNRFLRQCFPEIRSVVMTPKHRQG